MNTHIKQSNPINKIYLRRIQKKEIIGTGLSILFSNSPEVIGFLLSLAYFLRSSILTIVVPFTSNLLFYGVYTTLFLSVISIAITKYNCNFFITGTIFIILIITSSSLSFIPNESLPKGALLSLLLFVVGPVIIGKYNCRLRTASWTTCRTIIIVFAILSAGMFFFKFPVLGRGSFTGVMTHCMTLGPISGLACLFALNNLFFRRTRAWFLVFLVCVFPCFASGSRTAVISLAAGLIIITLCLYKYNKQTLFFLAILSSIAIIGIPIIYHKMPDNGIVYDATSDLRNKGTKNSRKDLWQERINDFKEYPVFGIGIGIGKGSGIEIKDGKINIEPGSSYLAILSMMGLVGSLMLLLLFFKLGFEFKRNIYLIKPSDFTEIVTVCTYLMVHAISEGWLLAVGSLECFIFWLLIGHIMDLTSNPCNLHNK